MHLPEVFVLCLIGAVCVVGSHIRDAQNSADRSNETSNGNVMAQCNQSYPIKQEYLTDLNTTGSFSDESEKTPMCFVHCFLTKIGIIGEESQINGEKAANVYELEDEEMVDDCKSEMIAASISDPCAKAYFFLRCLMTRTMIDRKQGSDESVK